jgi:hypothetical protein
MKFHIFEILNKAKPDTENICGLNLAAIRRKTGQVTKLPSEPEWLMRGHNVLYRAALKEAQHSTAQCAVPWRPLGLWDVKDPTLFRQSAHS